MRREGCQIDRLCPVHRFILPRRTADTGCVHGGLRGSAPADAAVAPFRNGASPGIGKPTRGGDDLNPQGDFLTGGGRRSRLSVGPRQEPRNTIGGARTMPAAIIA